MGLKDIEAIDILSLKGIEAIDILNMKCIEAIDILILKGTEAIDILNLRGPETRQIMIPKDIKMIGTMIWTVLRDRMIWSAGLVVVHLTHIKAADHMILIASLLADLLIPNIHTAVDMTIKMVVPLPVKEIVHMNLNLGLKGSV